MSTKWKSLPTRAVPSTVIQKRKALPSGRCSACLIGTNGTVVGHRYPVGREVLIGRVPPATILINSPDISRAHARLVRGTRDDYVLEDCGSENGTYVNGEKISIHVLSYGDTVHFGLGTSFVFTHKGALDDRLLEVRNLEAVSQIIGGVAHHFNNPLMVLLFALKGMETLPGDTCLDSDTVRAHLGDIRATITLLSTIVRQLLDASREATFEEKPVDISTLVRETLQSVPHLDHSIEARTTLEPNMLVRGDRTQLARVLLNLCENACEAMPRGGRFTIKVSALLVDDQDPVAFLPLIPGPHIEIIIKDSGSGMDDETRRRAFEPFFSTKGPSAAGLGLPAAQRVVQNHGGYLAVRSNTSRGTTLRILLPQVQVSETGDNDRTDDRLVIVADKSSSETSTALHHLRSIGYRVQHVHSGAAAVMTCFRHRGEVCAAIIDAKLPGPEVEEVSRVLKIISPNITIVCTGKAADLSGLDALRSRGVLDLLIEPYSIDELQSLLC